MSQQDGVVLVEEGLMALEVTVDYGKCCGYGICVEVCPEVFSIGSGGLALVTPEQVADSLGERVREAAEACPELAIDVA